MQITPTNIDRKIYTVSQLTDSIKKMLEDNYSMVWISGETSNLRIPRSGHAYFTLKDDKAQISAVMFRGQLRQLKFDLDEGLKLTGLGRISVYPPRGNYQIILEYAEPQGAGALQLAFEQLKRKLEKEGLFSDENKQQLPFLPRRPGIITSPSGAVIQDILKIVDRRYPNLPVDIYPVRVQGNESVAEIARAIEFANNIKRNDLLIIARGGGSIEDLAAFNSEIVARSIHASQIPIISAIGHETDYTISDFVADLRAPTPSAAAELAVPIKTDIAARMGELKQRGKRSIDKKCQDLHRILRQTKRLLVHPGKKVQDMQLHLDNLAVRLERASKSLLQTKKGDYQNRIDRLSSNNPIRYVDINKSKVEVLALKLLQTMRNNISLVSKRYKTADAVLGAVNPTAILNRGYSITRTIPDGEVVMDAEDVMVDQRLEIQLAKGKVDVSVIRSKINTISNGE